MESLKYAKLQRVAGLEQSTSNYFENVYRSASFPSDERYNLTSQIKRSASSIGTNIAEGCGRFTQKELANFLQIALGSTHELEYQLLLSNDLKFIDDKLYLELNNEIGEIKAMLISLIKKVRQLA